jgi:hypothetical protein
MKIKLLVLLFACTLVAVAASAPDLSGTWVFNPAKSRNIGMMASAQLTSTVTQTDKLLTVEDISVFAGQKQTRVIRYDLTGTTVANEAPMGEKSQTTSHWSGGKLITSWVSDGAIAGTKVVRTETRYLSEDGKTLFLESSRNGKEPMVLVFDRK